jgi:hypothetical protein
MARLIEVPSSSTTLMSVLVLMFTYLFPCKIGTNVCAKILGNKKLLALVECLDSSFSKVDNYIDKRFLQKLFCKSFN